MRSKAMKSATGDIIKCEKGMYIYASVVKSSKLFFLTNSGTNGVCRSGGLQILMNYETTETKPRGFVGSVF